MKMPVMVRTHSVIGLPRTLTPASTPTLPGSITTSRRTARKPCLRAERRKTSRSRGQQQFPGQSAATTILDDSKGLTVGLTSLITPKLINDFRWGFIRQGGQNAGASFNPAVLLDGIDNLVPFTRSTIAFVPVNQFTDSLNWTRKNHTFEFGTDLFSDSQQPHQLP